MKWIWGPGSYWFKVAGLSEHWKHSLASQPSCESWAPGSFGCSRTWVSLSVNSYIPWGTFKGFLDGSDGKESTCNAGAWFQSLGREDPLENGMAIHSSILAWWIPWTEEPGGLQSMGLQKVGHGWATNTHTLGELLQFWLQKHVPDPQSPSLPKTPGGAGENAPTKTVLMSSSSSGTHGRGSVSRKISEMAVPVLGVRQEPSESVEGDRSVAYLFLTFFFFCLLPFLFICNWFRHTVVEKRLYQEPLLQNDDFCLSAIGGYRSFLLYEGTFPLIFLLLWMNWVFFQTLCKLQLFFWWLRILAYTPHYFFEFFKKFFFEFLNKLAQFILSVTLTSVRGTLSSTPDVFAFNASHPESWFYSVPLNYYF